MTEISGRRLLPMIGRGKTILGAWMELRLGTTQVDGLTLDLGSGGSSNFVRLVECCDPVACW